MKQQIKRQLVARVISDKCLQNEYLIFREAWCSQERVIRFTTPFFRRLFSVNENGSGKWKTGDSVMYEATNGDDCFTVGCVLGLAATGYAEIGQRDALLKIFGIGKPRGSDTVVLKQWDLTQPDGDLKGLFQAFDDLIEKEIPSFEKALREKLEKNRPEAAELREGAGVYMTLNKYERSRKAREACIAAHGTACAVCGFDFGKAYGPEFAGKIEVHHIIPLSEIGEEYIVDPVKDLIPVCPNCHMTLHSKKDGVNTVEELREIRSRLREKRCGAPEENT